VRSHWAPASVRDDLLPVTGAARHARNLATEACLRWDLADLVAPVALVAGELVSNAVQHAHTLMAVRVTLGEQFVYVSVYDGCPEAPVPPRAHPADDGAGGFGLLLVDAMTAGWGYRLHDGGKTVWAAVDRGRPPG
jgi:anti-sigma regulatory factor (Ser/Thr protein kinase)